MDRNVIKRVILAVAAVVAIISIMKIGASSSIVFADEINGAVTTGKCGENAVYSFDEATGTLTISGKGWVGNLAAKLIQYGYINSNILDDLVFKEYKTKTKKVIVEDGITELSDYLFSGFINMESIELPSSVNSIGMYCFNRCTSLKSIELPSTITEIKEGTFRECTSLTDVTLSDGLESIDLNAFENCISIVDFKLPDTVKEVGARAFYGCGSLKNINIPQNLQLINRRIFYGCTSLKSISIPYTVTEIDEQAFEGVENLTLYGYYGSCAEKYASEHNLTFIGLDSPVTLNGWRVEEDGNSYWYEYGVKQGLIGRGKEIYDPDSDAWYWLDAIDGGRKTAGKDVYMESEAGLWSDSVSGYGKWVRYDADSHMVKGWDENENGRYYFDLIFGTMAKGFATIDGVEYYFNEETGVLEYTVGNADVEKGWKTIDGEDYWYENYNRICGRARMTPTVTVFDYYLQYKNIYDPESDAWYCLDSNNKGAKVKNKVTRCQGRIQQFADDGKMVKGWYTDEAGTYYYDPVTGGRVRGTISINGVTYVFDDNGVLLEA